MQAVVIQTCYCNYIYLGVKTCIVLCILKYYSKCGVNVELYTLFSLLRMLSKFIQSTFNERGYGNPSGGPGLISGFYRSSCCLGFVSFHAGYVYVCSSGVTLFFVPLLQYMFKLYHSMPI